jgi:hypothetical protein
MELQLLVNVAPGYQSSTRLFQHVNDDYTPPARSQKLRSKISTPVADYLTLDKSLASRKRIT